MVLFHAKMKFENKATVQTSISINVQVEIVVILVIINLYVVGILVYTVARVIDNILICF